MDGFDRRAEVAVGACPGTGVREGFGVGPGPGTGLPVGSCLGGDAEGGQEVLLVWVELVVLEARPGDPATQDGARCRDAGDGVEGFAGFDVVAGAVVVALPVQIPRRVPPRIDRGQPLKVG